MDIEQLKLILDTVKSTTGDAKLVAFAYLAYSTVSALALPAGALIALKWVISALRTLVPHLHENTQFAYSMRNVLLPDVRGNLISGERDRMLAKARRITDTPVK